MLFILITSRRNRNLSCCICSTLCFFGGRKIPELMRGIGKGIKEFNNAKATIETEIKEGMKDTDTKKIEEKK